MLAEELGLIGGVVIIALYVYFILLGFRLARNSPDVFSKVLTVGITSLDWRSGAS